MIAIRNIIDVRWSDKYIAIYFYREFLIIVFIIVLRRVVQKEKD